VNMLTIRAAENLPGRAASPDFHSA
jgi:hypothetical protein